jgi:hypothetical protein
MPVIAGFPESLASVGLQAVGNCTTTVIYVSPPGKCPAKMKTPETEVSGVSMAVNSQVPGPSIVPFSLPMSLRGAPNPRSSSCAGDGASSRLDSRILQRLCK